MRDPSGYRSQNQSFGMYDQSQGPMTVNDKMATSTVIATR